MRQGVINRLCKILLVSVGYALGASAFASETNGLDAAESERYLAELKALYLTGSEREALLAQSNALLETYALRVAYQVGQPNPQDVSYHLSAGAPGELRVREVTAGANSGIAVRNRSLSVFGLDPFLRYRCPPQGVVCVFAHPTDGTPWLTIQRDPKGAEELAKALSYLMRNLQKG